MPRTAEEIRREAQASLPEAAKTALAKLAESARARMSGQPQEANRLYVEAMRSWRKFEEESAGLHKPQPQSTGTYGAFEI